MAAGGAGSAPAAPFLGSAPAAGRSRRIVGGAAGTPGPGALAAGNPGRTQARTLPAQHAGYRTVARVGVRIAETPGRAAPPGRGTRGSGGARADDDQPVAGSEAPRPKTQRLIRGCALERPVPVPLPALDCPRPSAKNHCGKSPTLALSPESEPAEGYFSSRDPARCGTLARVSAA